MLHVMFGGKLHVTLGGKCCTLQLPMQFMLGIVLVVYGSLPISLSITDEFSQLELRSLLS